MFGMAEITFFGRDGGSIASGFTADDGEFVKVSLFCFHALLLMF
jgi:hypothetical protein